MKEAAIIGATLYGNRGAEAMLCATVGELRARLPDVHCHVYSYYPVDDRRQCTDPGITIHSATPVHLVTVLMPLSLLLRTLQFLRLGKLERWFPASLRALVRSRALIDLAGVSFIDERAIFLLYNTLTLWPAMVLGTPVVKLAQAMGPIQSWPNRLAARLTLPHCARIHARGRQTWRYLQDFGGCPVERATDVAFLYRPEYSLSEEEPASFIELLEQLDRIRAAGRLAIGLCPSSVVAVRARKAGQDYLGMIAHLTHRLTAQGYQVVLFPNATRGRYLDKLRNNDLPLIREIASQLDEPAASRVFTAAMDINTRAIRSLVSRLDLVITSRFHAMVAALALGVPTSVIGWSHKYVEVMEDFGQTNRAWDWRSHSVEAALESVQQLLEHRDAIQAQIRQALPEVQASAAKQLDFTAQLIRERS